MIKETLKNSKAGRAAIRSLNTFRVAKNQYDILKASKSNRIIFLRPTSLPLGGGNIEHYYHFVFDLLIPLNLLLKNTSSDVIFALEDFGIFTDRLLGLNPERIMIVGESNAPRQAKNINLFGMSPTVMHLARKTLEEFRHDIFSHFGIDPVGDPKYVLLIERMPPNSYFIRKAKFKGAGTSRRSITNHNDLRSEIQSMTKASFEFRNLKLENIPFNKQIHYFSKAEVVFGQHGAGLVNTIWMKPNSTVVELTDDFLLSHFKIISKINQHSHHLYRLSGPHSEVDLDDFRKKILDNINISCFKNMKNKAQNYPRS